MSYPRTFDWDDALRRYQAGETRRALAAEYGVTPGAVYLATDWRARNRNRAKHSEWQRQGRCRDCGGPASRTGGGRDHRCRGCWAKLRATTVLPELLQCSTCREWKPDAEYPLNRTEAHRRGRHGVCRGCQAAMRQRSRDNRKVPCVGCGRPRTYPADNTRSGNDTGLCGACYRTRLKTVA